MGEFRDIWHCAMNMRPSTCMQIVSPNSIRLRLRSVQYQSTVFPLGDVTSAVAGRAIRLATKINRFIAGNIASNLP